MTQTPEMREARARLQRVVNGEGTNSVYSDDWHTLAGDLEAVLGLATLEGGGEGNMASVAESAAHGSLPVLPPTQSPEGWQDISTAPKSGQIINVRSVTSYKWTPYKPDGRRQMGVAGRWQRAGSYAGWDNATLPERGEWTLNRPVKPGADVGGDGVPVHSSLPPDDPPSSSPPQATNSEVERLTGLINRELRSFELNGGNILDAIATYHGDKTVKEALEIVGDWSAWLARAVAQQGEKP